MHQTQSLTTRSGFEVQNLTSELSEQAVVANILFGANIDVIFSLLPSEQYLSKFQFQQFFREARVLHEQGKTLDYVTLCDALKGKISASELAGYYLLPDVPEVYMFGHSSEEKTKQYCKNVIEAYAKRQIYSKIQSGGSVEEAMQFLNQLNRSEGRYFNPTVLTSFVFELLANRGKQGKLLYPFTIINKATRGMIPGQMVIVAARPSVGKSAFLENVGFSLAEKGHKVLFASAEMDTEMISLRVLTRLSGINLWEKIPEGVEEEGLYNSSLDRLHKSGFHIFDKGGMTTVELEAQLKKEHFDAVCIDYLQLLYPSRQVRSIYEKVTYTSQELKALAIKYKTTFLIASQLSRGDNAQPTLERLRESGQVEQDADVVISLWNKGEEQIELVDGKEIRKTKTYIDLLKNRNGYTFGNTQEREYFLWFRKDRTQFYETTNTYEK